MSILVSKARTAAVIWWKDAQANALIRKTVWIWNTILSRTWDTWTDDTWDNL